MPNGATNGEYTPPPTPPGRGFEGQTGDSPNGIRTISPVFEKTKAITFGTSDQIYSAASAAAVDAPSGVIPSKIEVTNIGGVPIMLLTGYETYGGEAAADADAERYLHTMLMPGETWYPSVRALISTVDATTQFDGDVTSDNIAPSSVNSGLLWKDITANLGGHVNATTDPITITTASDHTNFFRVGDLIQIGRGTSQTDLTEANHYREILRVQSITNTTTMVCERALYGTDAGDYDETNWNQGHASDFPIFLPFFNAYHEVDKYSVAQSDSNGRFKCSNFFGLGRASSTTAAQGIMPGSIAIKFYEAGYQSLGLSGLTSSSDTKLTAGGSYWFKIAIDGGTAEAINFTVDSSNTNLGGTNGVISKIQDALNDKYNNSDSNTFQQRSNVGIVGGDIRFTSGQRLSTSAIALTAGTDGASAAYNIFAQQNGWFPALANIRDAIAARLPDDVLYDRITYAQVPNSGVFGYDDGYGNLSGMCTGTINYETGAIDMIGCPVNAEFVYTVAHTSVFAGRLSSGKNAIVEILANTPSQKWDGVVKIRAW